jgi:integrase
MASITTELNERRSIQFVALDGKRLRIRLGKVSERFAETTKDAIEQLLAAKREGRASSRHVSRWVAEVTEQNADLARKLARVGLIAKPEQRAVTTLGEFLDVQLAKRTDIKPASLLVQAQVVRNLKEHFGATRDPGTITPGNADDFRRWLVTQGLASTTVHKRLQHVRAYFRAMLRHKLIAENPFAEVRAPATGIAARQRFVTREETARVLEASPNHHWRTIVTLARYGGLRCPSEVLSLRWQDVDWAAGRIIVQSPKGECHGKGTRTIPLFPELKPILEQAWELADDGAMYIVDERMRKSALKVDGGIWANCNLRTTLEKIIERAGLKAWPRLFHNLRASRETELVERFPVQVVTSWLGNTPAVAMRHYLMTTDAHFAAALIDSEAAQKAAQQAHAGRRSDSSAGQPAHEKTPVSPGCAGSCHSMQLAGIAEQGFEP